MVVDILFLMAASPLRLVVTWWQETFGQNQETLDSEVEGVPDLSRHVNPIDAEGLHMNNYSRSDTASHSGPTPSSRQIVHRVSRPDQNHVRRSPGDSARNSARPRWSAAGEGTTQRSIDQNDSEKIPTRTQHEVWYPPPSAYADDLEASSGTLNPRSELLPESESEEVVRAREQAEEWRKYPPFPSAYPPTPLVYTSSLISVAPQRPLGDVQFAPISEEVQQDFIQSPLPPREPLNPGFAGNLGDNDYMLGVQNSLGRIEDTSTDGHDEDYVDTDISDDEDEFNITLRTPHPASGVAQSRLKQLDDTQSSSSASQPSRSTALTTVDNGSSLRTETSSDSSSSSSMSASDSSSLLSKKRSFPRTKPTTVRSRVRLMEGTGHKATSRRRSSLKPPPRRKTIMAVAKSRPAPPQEVAMDDIADASDSSLGNIGTAESSASDRNPPETKRRRVGLSPPKEVLRPSRPRATRQVSVPPTRVQQVKVREVPLRTSARLRPSQIARRPDVIAFSSSQGSSSSTGNSDPTGPGGRAIVATKKK